MTSASFNTLMRIAKLGQTIYFRSLPTADSLERKGVLKELSQDGLVLETDFGVEWIPAQDVHSWRLPKESVQLEAPFEQKTSIIPINSLEETTFTPPETPTDSEENSTGQMPEVTDRSLPTPADLELLFAGEPVMLLPAPSFSLPALSKDIQQDINRWKNRYDYAMKVHEPARMSQDVARIAELAELLEEPSLFYLAGLLSDYSGLGPSRAKTYFQNTLSLDQNHQKATIAIAALAIKDKDWDNAVKFLLWAVRLEGDMDKTNIIQCLGQCILRLKNKKYPLIGQLLTLELPETARKLSISLIALATTDTDAFKLALAGDVNELRRTKIGNDLFPWKDDIACPVAARNTRPDEKLKSNLRDTRRRGRVSAYYPGRNFGFIVENSTGQIWFFHKSSINSPSLQQSLVDGVVRQDVAFSGNVEAQSGKYPLAGDVSVLSEVSAAQIEAPRRASLTLRLQAIPRDGSAFAKAMEAEQLDQLDRAETFYREEITKRGGHAKSAVKNLAALKNRKGKPEAALKILDEHRSMFGLTEHASLDQMRVQFYVKARDFLEAANLLSKLAKGTLERTKQVAYQRQEAYCLLANGDFDKSIEKLSTLVQANPGDYASALLLDKAKDAKQTGLIPSDVSTSKREEESEDILSSLALGLSPIAQQHLEECEQRGIDARTRESGNFTDQDVRQVQNLLDNVKGRRPRERADYLLTLAWLCEHASNVTANQNVHEYLRRYFLALTEATINDGSPKDVVRCFALESLTLCPIRFESRNNEARNSFEAAWVLMLGTYFSSPMEPSILLQPDTGKRLPNVIKMLDNQKDAWKCFIADANFFSHRAPTAFHHLQSLLKDHPEVARVNPIAQGESDRVKRLESAFATLPNDSLSADRLLQTRESLSEVIPSLPFDLDSARIAEFTRILGDAADYALERHFRERETRYLRLDGDIERFVDELHRHPTHLSFEKLTPALKTLREIVRADFGRAETTEPTFELRNVLDNDFYVLNDEYVALRLMMVSKDESAPPVEAIGLVLEQGEGDPCHSPEPLHGGQTREIELMVHPTEKQVRDGAFTVIIRAEYRTRQGGIGRSQPFSLAVRLGEPSFEEIANPYSRYAGGSPVEERSMFFGRAALIDRVIKQLSAGAMGQCFVLYGQKRSGKSSVLKQVENRLGESVLYAPISAGTLSPGDLWCSFARLLLQELTFRLEDMGEEIPDIWPSRSEIASTPLESIRDVARALMKRGHKLVVAIDEFTYIFESAQNDVETFMRGWKALLEARTFNALLIGQDTMPRFKQAFPNEFGMTHDERITYLNEEEAASLATDPIPLNGVSRYRGQALHRLFDLTAGSPFFLQIACDRLVRHLNARKAAFVTEADIDQVARTLTAGSEALPPERFDALVTAAGEKVATIPRKDLWRILTRVAQESLHSGWCYRTALSELPRCHEAVKDLVDREILAVEGDRVRIRVGLFAIWLRANQ